MKGSRAMNMLKFVVLFQYIPRMLRIYPLYKEVTRTSGIFTETAFNLFLYMLASHVLGAFWYLFSIERETTCWRQECQNISANLGNTLECERSSLYCDDTWDLHKVTYLNSNCPIVEMEVPLYDFGIFLPALRSGVVNSTDFPRKFFYCFWWGLQNLRSKPEDKHICVGNLLCGVHFYIWFGFILIRNMQVPMFEKMNDQLMDAMCDRLKPVLYTQNSYIVRKGRTGFFNSDYLRGGDFCGEELLTWALDPHTSTNLNLLISTRTVEALEEVEAFALMADDLKFVASQFRRLHSKHLRHTFRFYSQQWRTWAACFIQAAWRRYCRKKLEDSLREEEEDRLQNALSGSSPSLGATVYASRFAANLLRALRRNGARKNRIPHPLILQKPTEPDFTVEDQ
ncbi:hypothetical protein L1987_35590 [Smallanthus sonchifolius]|uniref:Uncharacterized protein n=1 Tax=Smallanthus sonchifolius TaxID=185202 RepID=A0ACB9HCD2_9ASTR|nr:hypothetical protein L1987_35590 [Smallanthus sonchifolius]